MLSIVYKAFNVFFILNKTSPESKYILCGLFKILINLIFFNTKLKYIGFFYVLMSLIQIPFSNSGGNIAHLGGAILGFIFAKNFLAASKPQAIFEIKIKEFAQVVNQQFQARKEPETVPEDELNAILDKISQSGYDSLSDYEQKRLFKASQKND